MDFEYKDVTQDPEWLHELVEVYQSRATPTLVIGDEIIIGFDRERIEQLLELS